MSIFAYEAGEWYVVITVTDATPTTLFFMISRKAKRTLTRSTHGRDRTAPIKAHTKAKAKALNSTNSHQTRLRATPTAHTNLKSAITLPTYIEIA